MAKLIGLDNINIPAYKAALKKIKELNKKVDDNNDEIWDEVTSVEDDIYLINNKIYNLSLVIDELTTTNFNNLDDYIKQLIYDGTIVSIQDDENSEIFYFNGITYDDNNNAVLNYQSLSHIGGSGITSYELEIDITEQLNVTDVIVSQDSITVPSEVGTKLYLHTLTFTNANMVVKIISTDNTSYINISNLSTFLSGAVKITVGSYLGIGFSGGQYYSITYLTYDYQGVSTQSFTLDTTDLTETVTPL